MRTLPASVHKVRLALLNTSIVTAEQMIAHLGPPLVRTAVDTAEGREEQWRYPGYGLRFVNDRLVTAEELAGPTEEGASNQPLRVLMVEDVENDAELLACELARSTDLAAHVRVDNAATLTAALEQQEWDLILTDYTMPSLTVPTVLELVRRRCPTVPCILVSGTASEEAARAAMKLGVDDFVSKHSLSELGPVVARALDSAQNRRAWVEIPRVRLQGGHELQVTERCSDSGVLEGRAPLRPGRDRDGLLLDEGEATHVHMRVLGCEVWALQATRILYRSTVAVVGGWRGR